MLASRCDCTLVHKQHDGARAEGAAPSDGRLAFQSLNNKGGEGTDNEALRSIGSSLSTSPCASHAACPTNSRSEAWPQWPLLGLGGTPRPVPWLWAWWKALSKSILARNNGWPHVEALRNAQRTLSATPDSTRGGHTIRPLARNSRQRRGLGMSINLQKGQLSIRPEWLSSLVIR